MMVVLVSKAPDDPDEKRDWAYHMMRVQVAMWVDDGAICAECKKPYANTDDFLARNPRNGNMKGDFSERFIDDACWGAYAKRKGLSV